MANEWGYAYFKIDATGFGAYAGLRHDPRLNGIQTVRRVMETIRNAIGPDRYLLGCGVPFGAAVGLVDGERVSDDVSTAFRAEHYVCPIEVSMPQTLHRSFLQGKWWQNDPDCVLVRAQGTPHESALTESGLGLEEARFFVTVVGLTQGIQMVGENLPALDGERAALLQKILPPLRQAARVLDFFSRQPERLLAVTPHGLLMGLLNWGPEDRLMTIQAREVGLGDAESLEAFEFWTVRHVGTLSREGISLTVPAQGCRVVFLRPLLPHPFFLGCDGHLSCGADLLESESWDPHLRKLRLRFSSLPEKIIVFAPEGEEPRGGKLRRIGPRTFATCGEHCSLSPEFDFS